MDLSWLTTRNTHEAAALASLKIGARPVTMRKTQSNTHDITEWNLKPASADGLHQTSLLRQSFNNGKPQGLLATETAKSQALDLRISELTNEKAQVQDERNVAQEVSRLGGVAASQMLDCRDRLLDAMSSLVGGSSYYPNYSGMSARLDAAVPICQQANSSIDAFIGALP